MKVFVAGASGVVGRYLIPQLIGAGHDVVAMTRSPGKTSWLRELGAEPVLADALDQPAVAAAVARARPQAVVHQLTAIPARPGARTFDRVFAPTNRLRTGGTDILLAAARAAGARRFVAQSFCGWTYARAGGPVKTEEDPLDPAPARSFRQSLGAVRYLEHAVRGAHGLEGLALRYGFFYGPGTAIAPGGQIGRLVARRRFPVVGDGAGPGWSGPSAKATPNWKRRVCDVVGPYLNPRERGRGLQRRKIAVPGAGTGTADPADAARHPRAAPIAVRSRGSVNCYKLPGAVCAACGRRCQCNFAATSHPVCPSCSPKPAATCARCGQDNRVTRPFSGFR